jgi:spore maturation protein CgeB
MSNILIVGVFTENSTNVPMAISFMKHNFKVIPINYRNVISKFGLSYFNGYVLSAIKKYTPELILFSKCNGVNTELVKECSELTKTWLWNMDAKPTIQYCPEVIEHAKVSTLSSCTSEETSKWFEECGVEKCHTLFEGVDTTMYKPLPLEKENCISFIGSKTEERDEFKKFLEDNAIKCSFYGPGYTNEIHSKEFCEICSRSKLMLSLNTHNNIPNYFSDRIFRYMACKAPVFHWDSTGTLNKYFKDREEIFYFKDKEELLSLLTKPDEDLDRVAQAGYEKTLKNHTWDATITNILTIAGLDYENTSTESSRSRG